MCSVLFLPVQSLLACFRSSLTCFADLASLQLITLPQTVRLFYVSLRSQAPQPSIACACTTVLQWAYLSELLIKTVTNFDTTPRAQVTWSHITVTYVLRRGILKHCRRKKWLTYLRCHSKFITPLTFELSSFRENSFLVLLHFPRCSRWCLLLDA